MSASTTAQLMAAWLGRQMKKPIASVELRHLAAGDELGKPIDSFDASDAGDDFAQTTTDAICSSAQTYANGMGDALQTFVVVITRPDDKLGGRYSFRARGEPEAVTGYRSEPPTNAGMTAMLMRHLEARERIYAATVGAHVETVRRMADQLAKENEALRANRLKQLDAVEDLLSMRQERELEAKASEAKIALLADTAKELKTLAPVLVNRLAGRTVVPSGDGDDPRVVALKKLYESLEPEQIEKLTSALSPAQQVALAEVFREGAN